MWSTGINRNIVECKDSSEIMAAIRERGINRNIVECKANIWDFRLDLEQSINRNIVECKGLRNCQNEHWNLVLIETLWNVKTNTSKWQIGAKWY